MTAEGLGRLKHLPRFSLVARIVLVLLCVLPSWTGPFTRFERRLESPGWWLFCGITAIVFAVTARRRLTRLASGLVVAACIATAGIKAQYLFPMQNRVEALEFQDVPLRHVLAELSQQRDERPWYRFVILDESLRDTRLTVSVRDGDSLQTALDSIARVTGAEYDWSWFSSCGHSYPPTTVRITFRGQGEASPKGVWELVNQRVWLRDNRGSLLTDNNGVSFADAEKVLKER